MKRELDALLRAYADSKRRQAEAIEKFARALADVEAADQRFQRTVSEAFRTAPRYEENSVRQPRPFDDLFKELSDLSPSDLDAMTRSHP